MMGMTEAEFFNQSIITWNRRMAGFAEMHGGGKQVEALTRAELDQLMEEHPD